MLKYCILALGAAFAARLNAQSTMSCAASAAAPAAIRAESLADQVSDIVITCTGGTPAAAGASVAQYQVLVISDAPLATRTFIPVVTTPTVPDPNAPLPSVLYWTEALLLVDEPAQSSQIPCVPADGSGVCAITAGDASAPNVFQAQRLQDNMLVFPKIPIDAPGPGKSRTIRITNLRVDGTKVSKDSLQTTLQAQIFDRSGNLLSLTGASQVAAVVNPGYKFSIRTAADSDPGVGPGLLVTPTMLPQSTPGTSVAFHVKFSEGFPSAFKRRNLGTNSLDPTFLVSQADPVGPSNTETGFYNSAFPQTNNLNTAGLADSGTRLRLVLTDIPDNVFLEVSARDVSVGTTGYSDAAPRALLTYADDNGGGSFSQNHPGVNGLFSVVQVYAGTVTLTWEVVAADPNKIEDYSFEIRLFSPNGVAKLGTAMAHGTVGPIYPGVTTAPSGTPTVMPVPAFTDSTADPVP
ncbi:MAG: hypothetical protein LAO79_13485, partial [Acidobacteriia bacterium]|nr:hypothetical protein [Terriglobia bacterium]